MISTTANWIRRREDPMADRLYRLIKRVQVLDMPVLPGLHMTLYRTHRLLTGLGSDLIRRVYWTPMFRARCGGTGRRLHIAGGGMPFVSGPVRIQLGDDCRLSSAMTISGHGRSKATPEFICGENVGIGWQTTVAVGSCIVFEDNVRIGGRAFFAGYPGHPVNAADRAAGLPDTDDQIGDIVLRRDVWIGTGCTVNVGVEIGAGTIVAAGSVVTKSLPAGVLAGGVPARVIRALNPEDRSLG
ncbi:MAG: acyltransferase [Minwuia sp.]|uniref:acyltransferase n=1 Tax=Minwuia sp. TaxID=2493630 RepID=UPI003A85B5E4